MKILVLMGGKPVMTDRENPFPIFMTEVNEKTLLEYMLEKYATLEHSDFIFCVRHEDIESMRLDAIIKCIIADAKIVTLAGQTGGAVCTALLATEFIDCNEPLLIVSVDDFMEKGLTEILSEYEKNGCDVGIATFSSVHPRYSFVRRDRESTICEVVEKKPVSREALASFYYFKCGKDFVQSAYNAIRKERQVNGAFYISGVLNEMILAQKKICVTRIENKNFRSFKTERQLLSLIDDLRREVNGEI